MKNRWILFFLIVLCFGMEFSYAESSPQNQIVLFVSLGMPDDALKAYLKQAEEYQIPVVIRGLYSDEEISSADNGLGSFQKTTRRIFQILKDQNQDVRKIMGGISINPLLFRQYRISVVPALVVNLEGTDCHQLIEKPSSCQHADFDVVYGNVPIEKQLSLIAEKSKNPARALLAKTKLDEYSTHSMKSKAS